MRYDRKIKYFDYIKEGERIQGAGFLKIDVRGDKCLLHMQISGLHVTDTFCKKIYLIGNGQELPLCEIKIQEGRGIVQQQLSANDLCAGLAFEDWEGVRIPIAVGRELYCKVAERMEKQPKEVEEVPETEALEEVPEEVEKVPETEALEEASERRNMLENKWKQLLAIYPHICPFEDEREYLRIAPEDFVILNQRYYQLVHNSFLLHGYYNYQHLILTCVESRTETCYYIGVPGNFYEREKQVAMLFGFESFECKEKSADVGDYGYYMIRVEL